MVSVLQIRIKNMKTGSKVDVESNNRSHAELGGFQKAQDFPTTTPGLPLSSRTVGSKSLATRKTLVLGHLVPTQKATPKELLTADHHSCPNRIPSHRPIAYSDRGALVALQVHFDRPMRPDTARRVALDGQAGATGPRAAWRCRSSQSCIGVLKEYIAIPKTIIQKSHDRGYLHLYYPPRRDFITKAIEKNNIPFNIFQHVFGICFLIYLEDMCILLIWVPGCLKT